jgi:hypothetical protein
MQNYIPRRGSSERDIQSFFLTMAKIKRKVYRGRENDRSEN